jgi:hypothetical protein
VEAATTACDDLVKDGDETDVDCGGSCAPCAWGSGCGLDADCKGGVCDLGLCAATCTDGAKNAGETDVDCGGAACGKCPLAAACVGQSDCASGACVLGVCAAPACDDLQKNGAETDVDCGGPDCPTCGAHAACDGPADCASAVCTGSLCQAAACDDGVRNGGEADVDCGSGCPALCAINDVCGADGDCASGTCTDGVCWSYACTSPLPFPVPHCTNVAVGKVTSGTLGTPESGNDGDCATVTDIPAGPTTWTVDLGVVRAVRGVTVSARGYGAQTANLLVAVSSDGASFHDVVHLTNVTFGISGVNPVDFGGDIEARYVRLGTSGASVQMGWAEVGVFACP